MLPVRPLEPQHVHECPDGEGLVTATVRDRATSAPLTGAAVHARWREGVERQATAITDTTGRATLCLRQHQTFALTATYRAYAGAEPTTFLMTGPKWTYQTTIDVPGSFVRGRTVDSQSGLPVAGVSVRVHNTPFAAVSDTSGRFMFARMPSGDYRVSIEHIAYARNESTIRVRDDDLDALVRLTPAAVPLAPIVVTAFSRRLDDVGFYERRKRGVGAFFDRRQIDAMNVHDASDLLRRLPQLKLVPQLRRGSVQQRNAMVGRRGNCRFVFIIDGSRTLPDFEMDFVAAGALEGVEVYNGLAEVPASFKVNTTSVAGSTVCGVIAIWTRDSR